MNYYADLILYLIVMYFSAVYVHEQAHNIVGNFYGVKGKIQTSKNKIGWEYIFNARGLTQKQLNNISFAGIIGGITYLLLWSLIIPETIAVIPAHFIGSISDLKEVKR